MVVWCRTTLCWLFVDQSWHRRHVINNATAQKVIIFRIASAFVECICCCRFS
jgi:hypothetical protein